MKLNPKLDRWVKHGNVLVGYLFDWKGIPNGTRVKTAAVVELDIVARRARCIDSDYVLITPGTFDEHNQPLLGSK